MTDKPESPEVADSAPPARARRTNLGTWLANPLLVTVVAALLGSWLLPQVTRKWQDHQKALEIQTGLVSEMSESASNAVATSRFIAAIRASFPEGLSVIPFLHS